MTRSTTPFWLDPKLWAISVAETLAWAGLFYMFPALLLRWNHHFGWSISELSFGLMLALVISAVVGILSGKLIDKGFGRPLVALSVIAGGLLLLFLIVVQELWQFYLVWGSVGVFMGGCFYDPCFALLTRKYGKNAKGPIVMVTFFAGLAITVGFPISSIVANTLGWKASVFTFSSFLMFISGPLFWYGYSDEIYSVGKFTDRVKTSSAKIVADLLRNPIFWGLSVMFTAFGINHIMILSQILPILDNKGFSENGAVLVATFMGPMQVSGRMLLVSMEKLANRTLPSISVSIISSIVLALASMCLYFSDSYEILIIAFLIFQGCSFGIINIIKPVITAELLGQDNFGFTSSIVGFGYIWGFAFAPGIAGLISDVLGTDAVIKGGFYIAVVGLLAMLCSVIPLRTVRKILR